jgi:hypothetical protein
MSIYRNLFVGPYARWLVSVPVDGNALRQILDAGQALCTNAWSLSGQPPEVTVGGSEQLAYCFMPDVDRPGRPEREMWLGASLEAVEDWSEVGRKEEMDWFAQAFADELRALADFFGQPPEVRWGLVAWPT